MKFGVFMATATLAASASLIAVSPANAAEQDESVQVKKDDELVCKRFAVTGSRVKQRVCRTEAQWERIAEAGRRNAASIQGDGVNSTRPDS